MTVKSVLAGLSLALFSLVLSSCGGSTPAQPAPVPTPVPKPTTAPPPSKPLSVIPPCPLPPSKPAASDCGKPNARLGAVVNAAIDRTIAERPDLFDPSNVNGGPLILNVDAYMTAVAAAVGEGGQCAKVDPEGEIGVKSENSFNEQWIIASRVGWGFATDHWVQRKYVGACNPSTF